MTAAQTDLEHDLPDLSGDSRRRAREKVVKWMLFVAAGMSMLISAGIIFSLAGEAFSFITRIEPSQLLADGWITRRGRFNVFVLLWHTTMVSVIALLVAGPLGLGAAVYMSEYAKPGARRVLKPTLEVLAGIPSVVIGFFALTFITPTVLKPLFGSISTSNLLAAGIGVGILVIPLVASISEDAMRAVPAAIREASYGLGAKQWHTSLRVVFPAALSGIVAALILAFSRAIGETMVVALAAGFNGTFTPTPLEGGLPMTGAMAQLAIGSDQVRGDTSAFQSLFFIGFALFLLTFILNVGSERIVRRFRQRY